MSAYNLKVTSGAVIGGAPRAPGHVALNVPGKLAKQLLERGKVVLATDEEAEAAGAEAAAEAVDVLATDQQPEAEAAGTEAAAEAGDVLAAESEPEGTKPGAPRKAAKKPAADGGKPEGGK